MNWFTKRPWALHNPLKGWTLTKLSQREVQVTGLTLSSAEQKLVLIFCEGWETWRPWSEVVDEWAPVELESMLIPDLPSIAQEACVDEITQVKIAGAKSKEHLARRHDRVEIEMPVEVHVGPYHFSTTTKDISPGGIRFSAALPEWVAGYFTVVIHHGLNKLELTCSLVEDQKKDKTRVEILADQQKPEVLEQLEELLQSYSN